MALSIGIIGLPNVGKSTLLNALSNADAEASNYPFCTIDCNQGVVAVPDERLEKLQSILEPKETIPATVTFIDIAGLVEGASHGEGLGNKFLHHVREANVLAHVLRCFQDENVAHVHGAFDPVNDLEIVETELFLADLERIEHFLEKERHHAKAVKKGERRELDFLEKLRDVISRGERIGLAEKTDYQEWIINDLRLLTMKPRMLVLNTGEEDPRGESGLCMRVKQHFGVENTFVVSAKIEAEIAELPGDERDIFMREMGIEKGAKERFIEKSHDLLGLIRFYTTAHDKLQAWSLPRGTTAPRAAGMIHSDMEKGFIRAEVMGYEDLVSFGSRAEVQHHGLLRTEGHNYVIQDGDVVHILFNP
ncbi:MAG: redox-regulated ATPase YchF [bacterium]|nr:MAG: redox-regulated ATPase YchF [bacterium]